MKRKINISIRIIILIVLVGTIVSCQKKGNGETGSQSKAKKIRIACMEETEPIVGWIKEGLESLGYNSEIILYSSNQLPATALKDGEIDGVILNQLLWINTFNKENNCELKMVDHMYYGWSGLFSTKHKGINDLPRNAKIAIPGDPSNMEKALLGLEKAQLIKLGAKTGKFFSLLDIGSNPKNIKFIETERGTTARSINDVDAIVCGATEAKKSGIDITKYLYNDFNNKSYPHGLIVNPKDVEATWVKEAIKISKTKHFKDKFLGQYGGTYIPFD